MRGPGSGAGECAVLGGGATLRYVSLALRLPATHMGRPFPQLFKGRLLPTTCRTDYDRTQESRARKRSPPEPTTKVSSD